MRVSRNVRTTIFLALTSIFVCHALAQTVPVVSTITDGQGQAIPGSFWRFELWNCGPNFPTVQGSGIVLIKQSFDLKPDSHGQVSGSVMANDQILCGNVVSTRWNVTPMKDATTPLNSTQRFNVCSATAPSSMQCGNVPGQAFNPATAQPDTDPPPTPGYTTIVSNAIRSQTIVQPAGTLMGLFGTFDFTNANVIGLTASTNAIKLQGQNICPSAPADTQVLTWVAASNWWCAAAGGGSSSNATSIQGVNVASTAPASSQFLGYNGTTWLPTTITGFLPTTGGTLTGSLTLPSNPSSALQAATKQYVDTGLSGKADVIGGIVPANELGTGATGTGSNCLKDSSVPSWGTCPAGGGGTGNVSTTPTADQVLIQPAGTVFDATVIGQKRQAARFDWLQTPSGSIFVGANTVTLSNGCPRGVSGTANGSLNANHWIYITSAGTDAQQPGEPVLITGGSCVPGAASGTITFNAAYAHANGYTIGSGTGGLKEALNDANTVRATGNFPQMSWVEVSDLTSNKLTLKAPFFAAGNKIRLVGGALIGCELNMSCIQVGDTISNGLTPSGGVKQAFGNGNQNAFADAVIDGFHLQPTATYNTNFFNVAPSGGLPITQGQTGLVTLTFATCPTGFWPLIPNQILWLNGTSGGLNASPYAITAPGPGEFVQVTGGSCTPGASNGTIIVEPATPGLTTWAAHDAGSPLSNGATPLIEDNTNNSKFLNISINGQAANKGYGFAFMIDNDQSAEIHNFNNEGGIRSDADFNGAEIFGPGPATINAGRVTMDGGTDGGGTCVEWYDGNDISIGPGVCQAYNDHAAYFSNKRGGSHVRAALHGVHRERGGLNNTLGMVGAADVIVNGDVNLSIDGNGQGANAWPVFPVVGSPGGQLQVYYLSVLNTTDTTKTPPIPIGQASVNNPNTNNVTVKWVSADVASGKTIQFELYRLAPSVAGVVPYPGICDGLGGDGSCLVATAISPATACDIHGACTFTDNVASPTGATLYTGANGITTGGFFPFHSFAPGGIDLFSGGFYQGDPVCLVNAAAPWLQTGNSSNTNGYAPANCIPGGGSYNPFQSAAPGANGNYATMGVLLPDRSATNDGGNYAGMKGKLNLIGGGTYPRDLFTWLDSNPAKTFATKGAFGSGVDGTSYGVINRPIWDTSDIATGIEKNGGEFYERAPTGFDWYINTTPSKVTTGSGATARLLASGFSLTTPINVTVGSGLAATLTGGLDLTNQPQLTEIANCTGSPAGTTLNKLTKLSAASSCATIAVTSDTAGAVGVVWAGAGTTGNAQIAQTGQASCVFDGAITYGDYVQISTTVGGDCHDSGNTVPGSGQVIGRIISPTNASAGTYQIVVLAGGSSGGGSGASSVGLAVNGGSSSGIFSITGSPVTNSGNLNLVTTVTSGGLVYGSNSTTASSSGAGTTHGLWLAEGAGNAPLTTGAGTANQPLLSGGASADPAYASFTLGAPTSGGILCGTSSSAYTSSSALTLNTVLAGGGPGNCPQPTSITDNGTTVTTSEAISANGINSTGNFAGMLTFGANSNAPPSIPASTFALIAPSTITTSWGTTIPSVAPTGPSVWVMNQPSGSPFVGTSSFNLLQGTDPNIVTSNNFTGGTGKVACQDANGGITTSTSICPNPGAGTMIGPVSSTANDVPYFLDTGGVNMGDSGVAYNTIVFNSVSGTTNALPKFNAAHRQTNSNVTEPAYGLFPNETLDITNNNIVEEAGTADAGYNAGNLACLTASATVGNCASGAANLLYLGILVAKDGSAPAWVTEGAQVTVNSNASVVFTAKDYVCTDPSNGAKVIDNGTTPCGATSAQVGFVYSTDGGASTSHVVDMERGQSTVSVASGISGTLPVANGGTGTGSTLTGLVRGNASAMTAAELSGDVTTSGSNAATIVSITTGAAVAGNLIATNTVAPSSPSSGKDTLFTDSTDLRFHDKNASGTIGTTVVADTGASNNFLTAISTAGVISKARPACANLSDSSIFCTATGANNAQTATYQVLAADFTNLKTITVASGTFTITLVASGSQPTNGQYIRIINYGSGVVTIARSGQNLNGGTGNVVLSSASAGVPTSSLVVSDGTNYFALGAFNNPMNAAGDLIYGGTTGLPTRLATGTAKQLLIAGTTPSYIDFPATFYVPAASCVNTTAGAGWSTGSTPASLCRNGTNNKNGLLSPWGASDTGSFTIHLPNDWDSSASLDISLDLTSTDATNGHTIIMQASTACYKGDGSTTDDVAYNSAQAFGTITLNGNANRTWNATLTGLTKTGCIAGSTLSVKISRTTDTATNVGVYGATVDVARLLTVQAN